MGVRLHPGSQLSVVRSGPDGRALRDTASVTSTEGPCVTAWLNNAGSWEVDQPVVLLATQRGALWAAPALCVRGQGSSASFRTLRPWSRVNRRGSPRFPTRLGATLRHGRPPRATSGRLLDISAGGARVALREAPAGEDVELLIAALDHRATIPCSIVETTVNGATFETRLCFENIEPDDQSFLVTLLDVMGTLDHQGRDLLSV